MRNILGNSAILPPSNSFILAVCSRSFSLHGAQRSAAAVESPFMRMVRIHVGQSPESIFMYSLWTARRFLISPNVFLKLCRSTLFHPLMFPRERLLLEQPGPDGGLTPPILAVQCLAPERHFDESYMCHEEL